jgi:uncharacterized protein (TIGR02246 family)
MSTDQIAADILSDLEKAWNTADGAAFAKPFTPDATFVNIRGDRVTGPEIGPGHQHIFDTIYAGSTVRYELVEAKSLTDDVALAHFTGALEVPTGPLAGAGTSMASIVLTFQDEWRIAAFHNTLIGPWRPAEGDRA